ncbi:hypothetical protein [Ancylobacter rudongensis]|uniref:Uncharacterized protein n=1 Tax=Ancylobacter rudongensis TaxID=177413 RepID=A0A1G4UQK2_9HYPH|nr:hypothetical protein [Ancylobacter rudongensis]SCW95910.1 hypothetical protein SAMN05660859_0145 [Ancylobacter rudongensis]
MQVINDFHIELEQRADGSYARMLDAETDEVIFDWSGPHSNFDAAQAAIRQSLEQIAVARAKAILGIK